MIRVNRTAFPVSKCSWSEFEMKMRSWKCTTTKYELSPLSFPTFTTGNLTFPRLQKDIFEPKMPYELAEMRIAEAPIPLFPSKISEM